MYKVIATCLKFWSKEDCFIVNSSPDRLSTSLINTDCGTNKARLDNLTSLLVINYKQWSLESLLYITGKLHPFCCN